MKPLLQSIRKYCLWCCGGSWAVVKDCQVKDCPLWIFRFGKGKGKGSRLKAIRKRCLDCVGSSDEIKKCNSFKNNPDGVEECPLWVYRLGKNPKLKGKRGKGNPEAFKKYRFYQKHKPSVKDFERKNLN